MELRPYQAEAIAAIVDHWQRVDRTLLVLPTGCGKTVVFCKLAAQLIASQGARVLILAHRGELLEQAADKMQKATGLGCATEKAEHSCLEPPDCWFRIVVGSVQSMMRPQRLERFRPDHFDVIIVDEAHHCLADSYQRVLSHFADAKVLGVTATPDRGDMRNLGEYFDSLAYSYSLPQAIKEGYLVPIRALTVPLKIELVGLKVNAGDYTAKSAGNALDPYLEQIAASIIEHAAGRKVVIFLPLIATSQKMLAFLQAQGVRAAEVNGQSDDRAEVLHDFHHGKYDVLCNSMLLTEGWDCPSVDCVVCLRPTKVRALYSQIIGRGTRLSPETGKTDLLVLDFLWHTEKHELCRPAHLICESPEVATKMVENMEAAPGEVIDLEAAEEIAEKDCVAEREEALAKKLDAMKRRKQKLVDPLQFEMSIQAEDLANYVPAFGWEMAPPSDGQQTALEKMGINPDVIENAGKASLILDRLSKRRAEGLTTPKQIRLLESKGFQHVGQWEFQQARKLIDRIAGNRWRVPRGMVPRDYVPEPVTKTAPLVPGRFARK